MKKNITKESDLSEIKESLNNNNQWGNLKQISRKVGGSDVPFHILLRDFSIADNEVSSKIFSLRELAEQLSIFPDARKYLEDQTDFCISVLEALDIAEKKADDIIYRKSPKADEWFWKAIIEEVEIGPERKICNYIIARNNFLLSNKNKNSIINVAKAKEYPITSLLDFNSAGNCKCIFHNERSPSMHYYKNTNTTYCFSCNEAADSIKVYMKLTGASFVEAVKKLS